MFGRTGVEVPGLFPAWPWRCSFSCHERSPRWVRIGVFVGVVMIVICCYFVCSALVPLPILSSFSVFTLVVVSLSFSGGALSRLMSLTSAKEAFVVCFVSRRSEHHCCFGGGGFVCQVCLFCRGHDLLDLFQCLIACV